MVYTFSYSQCLTFIRKCLAASKKGFTTALELSAAALKRYCDDHGFNRLQRSSLEGYLTWMLRDIEAGKTGILYASQHALAAVLGCGRKAVMHAAGKFEQLGLFERLARKPVWKGGGFTFRTTMTKPTLGFLNTVVKALLDLFPHCAPQKLQQIHRVPAAGHKGPKGNDNKKDSFFIVDKTRIGSGMERIGSILTRLGPDQVKKEKEEKSRRLAELQDQERKYHESDEVYLTKGLRLFQTYRHLGKFLTQVVAS